MSPIYPPLPIEVELSTMRVREQRWQMKSTQRRLRYYESCLAHQRGRRAFYTYLMSRRENLCTLIVAPASSVRLGAS